MSRAIELADEIDSAARTHPNMQEVLEISEMLRKQDAVIKQCADVLTKIDSWDYQNVEIESTVTKEGWLAIEAALKAVKELT